MDEMDSIENGRASLCIFHNPKCFQGEKSNGSTKVKVSAFCIALHLPSLTMEQLSQGKEKVKRGEEG